MSLPEKTQYISGEEFDPSGMSVWAVFDNGDKEAVTDYSIEGFGEYEEINVITVGYQGRKTSFPVIIHSPESDWTVVEQPSCTKEGTKGIRCAFCGKALETEPIEAIGHDWDDGIITSIL